MISALAIRLGLRELRHEWQAALCFIAALVGVLAPLLLLLALKNGVIGTMVDRLVEDPSNREIVAVGTASFDQAFFDQMAARSDVGFIMPNTRRINAQANALRNPVSRALERSVPLIPSAQGDPLIAGRAIGPGEVWLSDGLAKKLELAAGDQVEMLIRRTVSGNQETVRQRFTVLGVIGASNYAREALFLSLDDLLDVEQFRDDLAITPDTYAAPRTAPDRYASFRLYAADLSALGTLLGALEDRGIEARARAENAALLLNFRDNLNLLYGFIAMIAVLGFWCAMAANLRGMVERQRVVFSLLRFVGLSSTSLAAIPVVQSVALVCMGVAVTLLLVLPGLFFINAVFRTRAGDAVAQLGVGDLVATLALGVITAGTAALWAMRATSQIDSVEVLRHA